jgi:hypothetical protein
VRLNPRDAAARGTAAGALYYDPEITDQELLAAHRAWAASHTAGLPAPALHANDPDPGRRLRVGYVSPDFRSHAVAFFLEPILASHDPAAVEVYCYAEVAAPDAVTARLRPLAHAWRDTPGLGDDELAALIREDGIDVLVDLGGHLAGGRLLTFARRPAPVQVSYLGYPGTTGLEAIHYRLTDAVADPPVAVAIHYHYHYYYYYYPLLRLPPGGWPATTAAGRRRCCAAWWPAASGRAWTRSPTCATCWPGGRGCPRRGLRSCCRTAGRRAVRPSRPRRRRSAADRLARARSRATRVPQLGRSAPRPAVRVERGRASPDGYDIEVHAVDAFDLQGDVIAEDVGDGAWDRHDRLRSLSRGEGGQPRRWRGCGSLSRW